ncbi:hypothetical protein BIW11_12536 [Tropilaelaps mercedesae]|uniref:Uncharacterized protein n=1 Tax=Tropilaelaps mercedesae TaxID=418985 RepID=A0A1V9X5W9_9ACAR|nr:hypothetical protein BIW11_12536 [Tropilaelaps mercedesae]
MEHEVVPVVLSPRTVRARRIAEAEKETHLNELASTLQEDLHREIFQKHADQADHAGGSDKTEFVNHYSRYLPSMRNPNVNMRHFQRDVHTPNLEELNIKKTSQVLISGMHGAPESGCSDSSPPRRYDTSPLYSPPGQNEAALPQTNNENAHAGLPQQKNPAKEFFDHESEEEQLATSINNEGATEKELPTSQAHEKRRGSRQISNRISNEQCCHRVREEEKHSTKVKDENTAERKLSTSHTHEKGSCTTQLLNRISDEQVKADDREAKGHNCCLKGSLPLPASPTGDGANVANVTKENEVSSRSETPSSSIELNCSKDHGKDAHSEYALLMGQKSEESPKPTALPLPPTDRRPSLRSSFRSSENTISEM